MSLRMPASSVQVRKKMMLQLFLWCNLLSNFYLIAVPGQEHVCLVVDEEGYVSVIDTVLLDSMKHDNYSSSLSIKEKWITHNNAVFDVTWIPQSAQFVTASGDTTAILWDVTRPTEKLCVFRGHSCSLKSVTVSKENPSKLAKTGAFKNVFFVFCSC